jgi:hypothetical protein
VGLAVLPGRRSSYSLGAHSDIANLAPAERDNGAYCGADTRGFEAGCEIRVANETCIGTDAALVRLPC